MTPEPLPTGYRWIYFIVGERGIAWRGMDRNNLFHLPLRFALSKGLLSSDQDPWLFAVYQFYRDYIKLFLLSQWLTF